MIIALSTCAAFATGRLVAWVASRRPRAVRPVRVAVLILSAAAALFFLRSHASRYALLLPLAFAAGALTARDEGPSKIF